jgi:hypothetical protein
MNHQYNKFISFFYIFVYTIFLIFGYSLLTDIINNKSLRLINFVDNSPNFIFKRLLQLSLITLLVSSMTFLNPNINLYIFSFILNVVVIIGYKFYFYKNDFLTFLIHIIMALPIFLFPFYNVITGIINYYYSLLLIIVLIIYKIYLFDYIYII